MTSIQQVGSFCIENSNLTIFVTPPNPQFNSTNLRSGIRQDKAKLECESFDQFSLGPIINEKEFNAVKTFIIEDENLFSFDPSVENHNIGFFIGMEALNGQAEGGGNTSAFTFVEEKFNLNQDALNFYQTEAGEFPWNADTNEPNNIRADQNCVQLLFQKVDDFEINGFLDDIECDQSTGFICRGFCADNDLEEIDDEHEAEEQEQNRADKDENMYVFSGMIIFGLFFGISGVLLIVNYKKHAAIVSSQRANLYMVNRL